MKLHPDTLPGNAITAYGPGWISVQGVRHGSPVLVPTLGPVQPWPVQGFDALGSEHFAMLSAAAPELVVFGSGPSLRFPNPAWLQALYAARIGVETMDTPAACRTFNFLASEGRRVLAALLL